MKVLPEPDGPHLRYSAEPAKHQPRRCHSRHLMHPATNVHTPVHRCPAKTTEEKVALGQMQFKFGLSVMFCLNKSPLLLHVFTRSSLSLPSFACVTVSALDYICIQSDKRWLCCCLILGCLSAGGNAIRAEKPRVCTCTQRHVGFHTIPNPGHTPP